MKDHSSPQALRRYAAGIASPEERRAVVRHLLDGCPTCQAYLRREFPGGDVPSAQLHRGRPGGLAARTEAAEPPSDYDAIFGHLERRMRGTMTDETIPLALWQETRRAAAAWEKARNSRGTDPAGPDPGPVGRVVVLPELGEPQLAWAVLHRESGIFPGLLLVAADVNSLVGAGDVAVAGPGTGALTLRCRFSVWASERELRRSILLGSLPAEALAQAEARWRDIAAGRLVGTFTEQETEDDPEYQDWIKDVVRPAAHKLEQLPFLIRLRLDTASQQGTTKLTVGPEIRSLLLYLPVNNTTWQLQVEVSSDLCVLKTWLQPDARGEVLLDVPAWVMPPGGCYRVRLFRKTAKCLLLVHEHVIEVEEEVEGPFLEARLQCARQHAIEIKDMCERLFREERLQRVRDHAIEVEDEPKSRLSRDAS